MDGPVNSSIVVSRGIDMGSRLVAAALFSLPLLAENQD
jgi:hypothetical protein